MFFSSYRCALPKFYTLLESSSLKNFHRLPRQAPVLCRPLSDGCDNDDNKKLKEKLSICDVDLKDKKVLMRVDFNVPMKDGKIKSTQRIVATLPTIQLALEKCAKAVILVSHLGRPDGRKNDKYTLRPVAPVLSDCLGTKVTFINDTVGADVVKCINSLEPGSVILLENVRFYAEETGKGVDEGGKKVKAKKEDIQQFRKCLRQLADIFIMDAFGASHRAHSSCMGEGYEIRAAGLLLKKELDYFNKALHNPPNPFLAILGGAKVKDKLPLIMNLLNKVNEMIIGGGMSFTFLKQLNNMKIGKSLFDDEGSKLIGDIMNKAKEKNVKIHLPVDFVCAQGLKPPVSGLEEATVQSGIKDNLMGLDVGKETRKAFADPISRAKLIVWNGPPGVFEVPEFAEGTKAMVDGIVSATEKGTTTIIGGGDTASAVLQFGADKKVSHVSTGGGASLELLEGKVLPAVAALNDK